jgi:hypothetical protein
MTSQFFVKELKGRFAQWYNRRHRPYGTLGLALQEPSLLLEGGGAVSLPTSILTRFVLPCVRTPRTIIKADPRSFLPYASEDQTTNTS